MKVVGYYNSFTRQDVLDKLYLAPITHINYAFLIPQKDGNVFFYDEEDVKRVVEFAHQNNKKVFVSVGGYCNKDELLGPVFEAICKESGKLICFIDSISKVVKKYNFDGVDLDWEFPTKDYTISFELLTGHLSRVMHAQGKELSIAVHRAITGEPKEYRIEAVTDNIIDYVDWLNIMTYDAMEDPNHSSLERCYKCHGYWHDLRGVPREKIVIGSAFYAKPSEKPYFKLIEEDKSNYFKDFYNNDTFNGCYTTKEKTYFARLNCGGLAIWAINYDSLDNTSLLRVISTAK